MVLVKMDPGFRLTVVSESDVMSQRCRGEQGCILPFPARLVNHGMNRC